MKKFHFFVVFWLLHSVFFAQGKRIRWENFNNRSNWNSNRLEAQVGFCATQFTGDLGGASGPGIDFSTKDMNPQATGKGLQAGFKFRFNRYFATKTELSYFELKGSDAYTDNPRRHARNRVSMNPSYVYLPQTREEIE